jgi:hypothetical protein
MFSLFRLILVEAGFRYGPAFAQRARTYFANMFSSAGSDSAAAQITSENQMYDIQAQRLASKLFEIGIAEGWSLAVNLYETGQISVELIARIGAIKEAMSRRSALLPDVTASVFDDSTEVLYTDDVTKAKIRSAVYVEAEKYNLT